MGVILHIIVVGFHHAHGPIVEYAFPPFPGQEARTSLGRLEVPEEWSLLPFLALPVKNRKDATKTLFGISCNRQILTKDLTVKTDDVTRTNLWNTEAAAGCRHSGMQFYGSLEATVSENIPDSAFMMGTSLRELVKKFKYKVLVLLKLLLLEKRVIFFGYPVETLCTYQYSLISLIPGLLKALQDTGSPLLDSEELYMQSMSKTPAHSTDKQELFKYLGLPLHIFGEGSFFQPYLPLQQIDILQHPRTRSYIIGTTNAIFLHNRDCATDVIVNSEPGTIEFLQDSLSNVLSLTSADRRWMDEIIAAVNDSGSNDAQTEYAGSDDYLRAKFEEYILTLLSSVKHAQFTKTDDAIDGIGNATDRDLTADYGTYFIKAWQQTPNYQLWNDFVDWELLNEIVAPGHPCQGNFSLAHVQRRLANQLKDMRIDKNLQPLKQTFSRAMTTSRERLSNVFDSVWQEFEKLQPEEEQSTSTFEPGLYSPRSTETSSGAGKGLIRSASTNPGPRPAARSVPDPELVPEDDDLNDAIPPPSLQSRSSRSTASAQPLPTSRPNSAAASPSGSTLGATLGPATAATAALGQKAVGMFSNVSSFFQTKKKELLEAQREAEEQYQQRIHQHERKKKIMQERARATASTFAISTSPKPIKPNQGTEASSSKIVAVPEIYAYVAPQSPRSPTTSTKPAVLSPPMIAAVAAEKSDVKEEVIMGGPTSLEIVSPVPVTPVVISPTLTRGAASDRVFDEIRGEDVDQQSQQEIEKELQEALDESNGIPGSVKSSSTVPTSTVAQVTPTRNLTPAECYSPFSEISAPTSPAISEADPLGVSTTLSDQEMSKDGPITTI
ncbi:late secretory pathway protein avl9 [Mortierella sp. GBA30]|nr:late secretory pathway protein avl9 [Mortierella sp. GBA30]